MITQNQIDNEIKIIEEINWVASVVRNEIKKSFGWSCSSTLKTYNVYDDGAKCFTLTVPNDFGIFNAIIDSAEIYVQFKPITEENQLWVSVSLNYQHPGGGRNGYSMMTIWLDTKTFKVIKTITEKERYKEHS